MALTSMLMSAWAFAAQPWDTDAQVQEVLALRAAGIKAIIEGRATAETERYSSTFVANTPGNSVVSGQTMAANFGNRSVNYVAVEQHIEYAGSHGPDMVVIMGEEIVVPGEGLPNAGRRIHRRFTDVFRREAGQWRHDLRHANVVNID
ncbi:MAG: hypothetical protein H6978_04850 [Gammaproteobacteria bacterium]|nr:hypothetical protein [Gammaproteobacteria bacterium]